jgi:hypothetical protein
VVYPVFSDWAGSDMGFDKFVAVSYEAHSTKYGPFELWATRWACSPQTVRTHIPLMGYEKITWTRDNFSSEKNGGCMNTDILRCT